MYSQIALLVLIGTLGDNRNEVSGLNVNRIGVSAEGHDTGISQNQTAGCGGVLDAHRGFVEYKPGQDYENNEKCIWVFRTGRIATLFRIIQEGFEPQYDYLTLYVLDKKGGLVELRKIVHGTAGLIEAIGPASVLTFTSDRSNRGQGFSIEYFGFGQNELPGNTEYTNSFSAAEGGSLTFPDPGKPAGGTYEALIQVLIPLPNRSLSITIDTLDIGYLYSGCLANYLSIHQLFAESFDLRLRNCERSKAASTTLTSSSPILISYKAFSSPKRRGLRFSWTSETAIDSTFN